MAFFSKAGNGRNQPVRLRLGVFEDLTTRLLVHGLDKGLPTAAVRRGTVDEVRQWISTGDVEVALLPVWDFLQVDNLDVIPGNCVSTFGPGNIFMLFSKVLPGEIRRVLADHESFGARSFAHILLPGQIGSRPEIIRSDVPLNPATFNFNRDAHDAYLVVGENALLINRSAFRWVYDLGQAWQGMARAPLVVHVWCCRRGVDLKGLDKELAAVVKQNLGSPGEFVGRDAERLKASASMLQTLQKSVLKTDFGPMEVGALRTYMQELVKSRTITRPRQFQVYRPPMNSTAVRLPR